MKKKFVLICCLLCLIISFLSGVQSVFAADKNEFPFISIDSYTVTKDKIIPGSDFTLTLCLRNNSETTPAKNVVVGVDCPAGVSPKYGTPGQAYFKEIAKGDTVETSFEFSTIEEIYSYYLDFQITIFGDESNNSLILRIPVGTDSPFNITNFEIDNVGMEGDTASASVAFKVIGIDYVKNVVVRARFDGIETNAISIGALSPGTSKSQFISIPLNSYGEHEIKLLISYEDAYGKSGVMEVGTQTIEVNRKIFVPTPTPFEKPAGVLDQLKSNTKMLAGIAGIVFIVIFSAFALFVSKKGKR